MCMIQTLLRPTAKNITLKADKLYLRTPVTWFLGGTLNPIHATAPMRGTGQASPVAACVRQKEKNVTPSPRLWGGRKAIKRQATPAPYRFLVAGPSLSSHTGSSMSKQAQKRQNFLANLKTSPYNRNPGETSALRVYQVGTNHAQYDANVFPVSTIDNGITGISLPVETPQTNAVAFPVAVAVTFLSQYYHGYVTNCNAIKVLRERFPETKNVKLSLFGEDDWRRLSIWL